MEIFRNKIDLGGEWFYSVNNYPPGLRCVPASYPAEGQYTLAREISMEDIPRLALNPADATFEVIDLQLVVCNLDQERIWDALEKQGRRTQFEGWPDVPELVKHNQESRKVRVRWQCPGLVIGGVPFDAVTNHLQPGGKPHFPMLLSAECQRITISIGHPVRCLHILGQVSIDGWPTFGNFGDQAAEYVLNYADGSSEVFPIRNGVEFERYRAQHRASRLNVVTTHARPVLEWNYDQAFDRNVVRYIGLHPSYNKSILSLGLNLLDDAYKPFIYAITIEN